VQLIGKSIGIGLAFAFMAWVFCEVLGSKPAPYITYIDVFLIAAFAAWAALNGKQRLRNNSAPSGPVSLRALLWRVACLGMALVGVRARPRDGR
jgi:hypothetical protein